MALWIYFFVFLMYAMLCRAFRFRRYYALQAKHESHYPHRQSLARMTNIHASEIVRDLGEFEFPRVFHTALSFALFKTFGIPSISALLVRTGALQHERRNVDTAVLMSEMVLNSPTSSRSTMAIARVNYLHSVYRHKGEITDADMLYTLSMFALEPIRWVHKMEWRRLTELEICAIGVFWKSLGDAMEIPYHQLTIVHSESLSSDAMPTAFDNGIEWLKTLNLWAEQYEKVNMLPAASNASLAHAQLGRKLDRLPSFLREPTRDIVVTILGERLRLAFELPHPAKYIPHLVSLLIHVRQVFLRHLMLPRPNILRRRWLEKEPDPITGRYYFLKRNPQHYYQRPSRWSQLTARLSGTTPAEATRLREGYKIDEVGPVSFEKSGQSYMRDELHRLSLMDRGGCPFAG